MTKQVLVFFVGFQVLVALVVIVFIKTTVVQGEVVELLTNRVFGLLLFLFFPLRLLFELRFHFLELFLFAKLF